MFDNYAISSKGQLTHENRRARLWSPSYGKVGENAEYAVFFLGGEAERD